MDDLSTPLKYKPVLISRRSEITAWLIALSLSLFLNFYRPTGSIRTGIVLLLVLVGLSAISISIGNWVDRHTSITINPDGVVYSNGITETAFGWQEISRVEVLNTQFGDKIIVSGADEAFRFQPLGTMQMSEKFSQRVGFEDGEMILKTILTQSGLVERGSKQTGSGYYYSRD